MAGVKGKTLKTAEAENRGTFSVDAAISADFHLFDPHIIFHQDSLTVDMMPPGIKDYPHLLLSNTRKGHSVLS